MASTAQMTIDGVTFDATTQIKYSKPKVNSVGGKNVNILNAETNKSLYITTPLMLTWGVNQYVDEKTGKVTYDMALQFPSSEYANEKATAFLENLKTMEEKVKADAITYSRDWLGKPKVSAEVVDALFTPLLKYPKDKNTSEPDMTKSPTLKVKLNYWEDEFKCELYDMNEQSLFPNNDGVTPVDLVAKGVNVACVINCGGIWFANGKFGVTWRLLQAVVQPRASMTGKCLIKLSDEEKASAKTQVSSMVEEEEEEEGVEVVADTDEEEEDDDNVDVKSTAAVEVKQEITSAPEPVVLEPEPPVEPKKKVVRKRTTKAAQAEA
jgi:hypothetical protein